MPSVRLAFAVALAAAAAGVVAAAWPSDRPHASWASHNADLASTRSARGSEIRAANVGRLRVAWRFRLPGRPLRFGSFASNPIAVGDRVYLQDLRSDVYALDRSTGSLVWSRRYRAPNEGPNGLAVEGDRLYGSTDTTAFALDRRTGRQLWVRRLARSSEQFVNIAPVPANGLVYTSTVGYPPGGRGALYALDAATGAVRWRFGTIREPWRYPREAGGGGAWFPVSVDGEGRVYAGTSNPGPWGGTRRFPNGGMYPGPALWTDSLLVLDGRRGSLLWYDQVTPHDVRDYDFQASPVLARVGGRELVLGAGKAGRVVAWERASGRRLWSRAVGLHRNDLGPLPRRRVPVCPGLLGGVLTPMAYAGGRLFVPVVDLCMRGSALGYEDLFRIDYEARGRGRVVSLDAATGHIAWQRRFASPAFACATVSRDVVFAPTYDGWIRALSASDGSTLWRARARAGVNACPAVAGNLLLVGAGSPHPAFPRPVAEVIAFRLPA